MACQDRTPDHSVEEALVPRAGRFSFFQLVRLLERCHRTRVRVGYQGPAAAEAVRFRADDSLGFPPTDVTGVAVEEPPGTATPRFRVTTAFLALYGSSSPLPSFYSEDLLWDDDNRNRARDFLDLFHHRLVSLFYRCWSKYRYDVQFEYGEADRLTPCLVALCGLDLSLLKTQAGLREPLRVLHAAGLFNQQPHSASALEGILGDRFDDLPFEVEQCTARQVSLRQEQLASLGVHNSRLGVDCTLGRNVLGRSGSFRIWIGPVDCQTFLGFLPDRRNHRTLRSLAGLFAADRLEFDVAVRVLRPPRVQLSSGGPEDAATRLGWTSWLLSDSPVTDREETVVFNRASLEAGLAGDGRSA